MPEFKLSDSGGSWGWIFEAYTDEQMEKLTDDEIAAEVDFHLEVAVPEYIASLSDGIERLTFPRWGYTSADRLENAEEYEAYYRGFMEDEIVTERESAIKAGKERREESRKIYDCHRPLYIAFKRTLEGDPEVWESLPHRLADYEVVLIDDVQVRPDRYFVDGVLVYREDGTITMEDENAIRASVEDWLQEHGYVS